MKYIRLIIILLPLFSSAQTHKYFVKFTDRTGNPYSISNPSAFLSPRAIARRANQGIAIQQNDLPVNPNYVDSVISHGAVVWTRSKWFNGVTIQADTATLSAVLALPFVQSASQVFRHRSSVKDERDHENKFQMPLSRFGNSTPHAQSYNYGGAYDQIHIMNGDYLHNAGYHGENMIIALLDAGFWHVDSLPAFDSIRTNNQIIGTWDFVANQPSVYEDYVHGMEVLSTIGGNVPGQIVGTAPKASFWLLRTEDVFSEHVIEEYNWDAGAEFADSAGADVISTSLGYTTFDNPLENHTYADMNGHTTPSAVAANIAFSKGMLVCASAGNSGGGPWQYIGTPADGDSVMAVGAVDVTGTYAFFSSTGPSSDGDVKPNVAAVGQGTYIAYWDSTYGGGNGTSFSCPVLAGAAACLWQAFPSKTNREVFDAIQRSATQYLSPDSLLGYGIPDFMSADFILGGVDVNAAAENSFVNVYPNPFAENVEVKFYSDVNRDVVIEVFDMPGRKVFSKVAKAGARQTTVITLPLSNLQSGIYFIKVSDGGSSYVTKAVKMSDGVIR